MPKWSTILCTQHPEIELLENYGPNHICQAAFNPFWKNVVESYKEYYDKVPLSESWELLAEPIFYNNKFKINGNVFHFKSWTDKYVFLVKDLLNSDGEFLSFEQFKQQYDVQTHFLDYYSCVSSIRKYLKTTNITIQDTTSFQSTKARKLMISSPKGCKIFYDTFIQKMDNPNPCKKWVNLLSEEINWDKVFEFTRKIKEIKLRWFQMRITYRIIVTNSVLKEMGIVESNNCSFCNTERDSIYHYLWSCPCSQLFWNEFERYLKQKCTHCERLKITKSLALFGCGEKIKTDIGFDFILLHAKYFVYKCRFTKTKPRLTAFLNYLKHQYTIDEYVHKLEMRSEKFTQKWLLYKDLFS